MVANIPGSRGASALIVEFAGALSRGGVPAALALLNATVPHRYTALYRLEGAQLHSVFFHDRLGEPRPEHLAVIDMGDSYCQYVLRDGAFLTDNSAFDQRLDGHPYQGVMVAYHGVPVLGPGEVLLGTLCHFDTEPRGLTRAQFDLMVQAAQRLAPWLQPGAGR